MRHVAKIEATLEVLSEGKGNLNVSANGSPAELLLLGQGILDRLIEEVAGNGSEVKKDLATVIVDHFNEYLEELK
ncbi:TPA_asm: hypothetical protein GD612_08665 [Listeria monocytogenes]|nr:hypothetical protein [Listeria monocytogenes]HAA1165007.1 hypothetical protein [Listeria monocytogenes]HAA1170845.1 hypothetical protein [Listeria monocytogenes]HAA1180997.1 hypothetical protein [Listeria monocytogenes]HAA1183315.1 hypothetical protein [Listeria monocytogenes]